MARSQTRALRNSHDGQFRQKAGICPEGTSLIAIGRKFRFGAGIDAFASIGALSIRSTSAE